ncbi:MAG: pentapeptide repeat-containing protein [Alphaproteobacteria bacterium]|nr:pentapeptide repeat-containing protein [Alphaproteobacteria bacterium]
MNPGFTFLAYPVSIAMEAAMDGTIGFPSKQELVAAINAGAISLAGLDLSSLDMTGVILRSDLGSEIDFSNSHLAEADFTGSTLVRVNFRGATMDGAKFDGARLHGCNFCHAKGWAVSFIEAQDEDSRFNDASFPRGDFRRASFLKSTMFGVDFADADFRGAVASKVGFNFSRFSGADLRDSAAQHIIERCSIAETWLDARTMFDGGANLKIEEFIRSSWIKARATGNAYMSQWRRVNEGDRRRVAEVELRLGVRHTHRGIEFARDIPAPAREGGCVVPLRAVEAACDVPGLR